MNVRNRLVNFRVTDEELQRLKAASALQNARCLSDFARSTMLQSTFGDGHPQVNGGDCSCQSLLFERRLAKLESAISRLVNSLENVDRPAVRPDR